MLNVSGMEKHGIREVVIRDSYSSLSRGGAGLCFGLLVFFSWLSHELVGFGPAFDHARFDATRSVAHFVAGDLPEVVVAQFFPNRLIRRHQPLRYQRIRRQRKTHLTGKFIVYSSGLGANQSNHIIG